MSRIDERKVDKAVARGHELSTRIIEILHGETFETKFDVIGCVLAETLVTTGVSSIDDAREFLIAYVSHGGPASEFLEVLWEDREDFLENEK